MKIVVFQNEKVEITASKCYNAAGLLDVRLDMRIGNGSSDILSIADSYTSLEAAAQNAGADMVELEEKRQAIRNEMRDAQTKTWANSQVYE